MTEIDRERFDEHVQDALAHLYDHLYLQTHPLAGLLAVGPTDHVRGRTLHRMLMEAIEALKPETSAPYRSLAWRKYRYLTLRYVEEVPPHEIAEELGVSQRQSRRDHAEATPPSSLASGTCTSASSRPGNTSSGILGPGRSPAPRLTSSCPAPSWPASWSGSAQSRRRAR